MKKPIISSILLFILIITLAYFINNSKMQRDNYSLVEKSINKIIILNKELNYYFRSSLVYDNFDIIQSQIKSFENEVKKIENNHYLKNINNDVFTNILNNLEILINSKSEIINKAKSHKAVLNNSFRIIQRLNKKGVSQDLNNLYTIIMTIDKNTSLNIEKELKNIKDIEKNYTSKYDLFFLKHSNIILKHQLKFKALEKKLTKLDIERVLNKFDTLYEKYSKESTNKADLSINILFLLFLLAMILYFIKEYKLNISNKMLLRFRKTLHNSNNIIVVTDKNEYIKYVNEAFIKTTGYSSKDVLGKKTNILKSGLKSKEFYKDLKQTIHSGKKWSGEFINKNKQGDLIYEKASITPVFDDNGKIIEFIAIKLDITKETIIQQQLIEQEKLLVNQSKLAAMGEMIANIAHQWRQPLSVISTGVTGMQLQKEYGLLSDEEFNNTCKFIDKNVQYLSNTIDDFRNFIKGDNSKTIFDLEKQINSVLHLVEGSTKRHHIDIILDLQKDIKINGYENELIQCFMNIYNNAKDALNQNNIKEKKIFISSYIRKNCIEISIKDNARGIPSEVLPKIFEQYFTTKHKSVGTGLGLNMTYNIIVERMNGKIYARNEEYLYKNKKYVGANFIIELPLSKT